MPAVVVKYKGQKALKALQELAKMFDMEIEQHAAKEEELPNSEKYKHLPIRFAENPDANSLSGIWKDNPVSLEEIRKESWGNRF